jgi:two-component system sensor histidine kinase CpxA
MAAKLEALVGSQRRLLRDVSHELRSPLARLGVALELARQRGGAEVREPHDRIEREAARLDELVGRSHPPRLDAASAPARREPVDSRAGRQLPPTPASRRRRGGHGGGQVAAEVVPGDADARARLERRAQRGGPHREGTAVVIAARARALAEIASRPRPGVPEAALVAVRAVLPGRGGARARRGGAGLGPPSPRAPSASTAARSAQKPPAAGLEILLRLPA